ncbi:MAG TPA: ABC transporter substrate binding protein [Thermoanaerobaculia bacterium]|nr:ABC transporter substrate binding protein [Thermoanaerobaculia bacterium]
MRRIGIINAYTLPRMPGRETLRMRAFVAELARRGWREGKEIDIDLVDAASAAEVEVAARRFAAERVDLLHTFGTPVSAAAAEIATEIPIVYYGAHPEGIGDAACSAPNVTGWIIDVPLTSGYKSFRLLPRLVPRARAVWVAFYAGTRFVTPRMRALHAAARDAAGADRPVWLAGSGERIGFKTLAGLCYVVGREYRELVYEDAAEIPEALAEIDPQEGVLMLYNEPFYPPGATEAFLEVTAKLGIPLVWNNNPQTATMGGFAGVGADFVELGRASGEIAADILAGAKPSDIPRRVHRGRMAWINLDAAERLGLDPEEEVLNFFDLRVRGDAVQPCM